MLIKLVLEKGEVVKETSVFDGFLRPNMAFEVDGETYTIPDHLTWLTWRMELRLTDTWVAFVTVQHVKADARKPVRG